jgi:hypothetical protein
MQGPGSVRVEVLADYNANGTVDAAEAMIINTATGETVSHVIMATQLDSERSGSSLSG